MYEIGKAIYLTAVFQKETIGWRVREDMRAVWLQDGIDRVVGPEEEWCIDYVLAVEGRVSFE